MSLGKRMLLSAGAVVLAVLIGMALLLATDPGANVVLVSAWVQETAAGQRSLGATLRNNTDRPYGALRLEVVFFAADGEVLGHETAEGGPLGAGEEWTLTVPLPAGAVRGHLGGLTCSRTSRLADAKERACRLEHDVSIS